MACPNEFLSDYFMKFRSWEWSFASLFFVRTRLWKVKLCQFKLQILYCATIVLSSKLFRLKLYLCLHSICLVKLLYKSEFNQSILLSSAVEGFTFFRLPSREAVWRVSNAPFCTAVDISTLGRESHEASQHACTPWCIPVPARHVGYIPL